MIYLQKNLELPQILRVKDVQVYLNISRPSAYRLFDKEDFPSFSIGGNKRVDKEDFLNWLDKQKDVLKS